MSVFCSAFNWCDGDCVRCPLAPECPLRLRQLQRDWVHTARHEDPDDPNIVMADVEDDMQQSLRLLREVAEEEGIDLDVPPPPEPISLEATRLYRAALAIATGLARAEKLDALPLVTLFVRKCARISMFLGEADRSGEVWDIDAVPNLFLLERLRADLEPSFEGAPEDVRKAIETFDRIIAPLIASIGEGPRRQLSDLIARNAAPSPFCRTG